MSYGIEISFVHAKDYKTAVKIAHDFTNSFSNNKQELDAVIKSNELFIPSARYPANTDREKDLLKMADRHFVYRLFTFKFVWFPHAKLLGMIGSYNKSETVTKYFPHSVYFQNSCDQDYEREFWLGIPFFENIYDEKQALSDDILILMGYDASDDFNYIRRTLAYDEIAKAINLDGVLEDKDDKRFNIRFATNAIDSFEKEFLCTTLIKKHQKREDDKNV